MTKHDIDTKYITNMFCSIRNDSKDHHVGGISHPHMVCWPGSARVAAAGQWHRCEHRSGAEVPVPRGETCGGSGPKGDPVDEKWGGSIAMGVPLNHPFIDGIFHYKPTIFGYPNLWKPPMGVS